MESGTLRFATVGFCDLAAGDYAIPFQMVSCLVMEPGTTVSHDALRILARHGTSLVFVGEDAVRFYASLPAGPDTSARARRQAEAWSNPTAREAVVRQMYAIRLGEIFPVTDLNSLRGIEGARAKTTYQRLAQEYSVPWHGRRYDRQAPESADVPNQCINHASSAVEGAALTAVAATGAIPQLGFIHEDSGNAFALDIADLFRDSVTVPIAFAAAREIIRNRTESVERSVRKLAALTLRKERTVSRMIDRIKGLFDSNDDSSHA